MIKNILLILCDQLRKDCLGCYGNKYVKTPNIDFIAKNGILFNRNYVANPICTPNRMSIFSGMYSSNHGLWTNGLLIKENEKTVTNQLSKNGVSTASIGKIHFEPIEASADTNSRESNAFWSKNPEMQNFHGPYWGFDYIDLHNVHGNIGNHMTKWFFENGGTTEMLKITQQDDSITGTRKLPNSLNSSTYVGEKAVNYLKNVRDKTKPFFLTASFTDPHHPFYASEESINSRDNSSYKQPVGNSDELDNRPSHYEQMYTGAWSRQGIGDESHPDGVSEEVKKARICNTYAMIELIDENVGKILKELDNQGLREETAIIFTSDHGELLGDYGIWTKGPFYYEGLMSTPLIVSFPSCKKGKSNALISSVDLAPTICEMLGQPIPYWTDGMSQLKVFTGETDNLRDKCMIEYRNGFGKVDCASKAIVTSQYKYVRYQNGEEELTDLINDPEEHFNLANKDENKELVMEMRTYLLDFILNSQSKKEVQVSYA